MAKPTALIILLAIALQLTFPLSNESTLGTAGKKFAGQGQFPASSGIPLFFIAPRLTKPRTTTTILVSCPRKHTRFRIQVPASIATLSVLYHASPRCTGSHFWCGKDRVMARPRTSKCNSESNGQDIERGMRDRMRKGGWVIDCSSQNIERGDGRSNAPARILKGQWAIECNGQNIQGGMGDRMHWPKY